MVSDCSVYCTTEMKRGNLRNDGAEIEGLFWRFCAIYSGNVIRVMIE